jgi:TolB protein
LNLTKNAAFDGWPRWSPDGRWIAFASNRAGPALVGQIYLVRPDGSDTRQVTTGPWSHAQPAFSPDGRTLFFYTLQEGADFQYGFIARAIVPADVH